MKVILYLFLFVLLVVYSWVQIYDGDMGHHLKAGEWMLAHGKLLDRDIFSFTARGNYWLNHSWLAEIILYYIYWLSGINGLTFFKIIILLFSYALLVRSSHLIVGERGGSSEVIIAILFIMSVISASIRFMVRPLIFSFLGVALSIYLFIKARKNINSLFFMPIVLVFWVNLHAEFMLGLIMVIIFWLYTTGVFVVEKIFKKKESCNSKHYLKANLILVLSIGALFITPYGIKLFIHPVKLTSSDLFMTRISEWLPPMHLLFKREIFVKNFYWFFGIGILSFLLNFKKRSTLFFLFFVAFGLMSFSAIRFIPYLTMLGIPIVTYNLDQTKRRIVKRTGQPIWPLRALGRGLLRVMSKHQFRPAPGTWRKVAIIAIIIWSIFLIEKRTRYTEFGLGLAEKVCYPVRAAEFLNQAGINGNMFNMIDFGGLLIWKHPHRPVFADGRLDVYGEEIYADFLSPNPETLKKYNINYIFISFRHPATRDILYFNEDWPLIYWDDTALIYLKRSEKNRGLIERYGYQYIHPLTGSYNLLENAAPELKTHVWKEIHRALRTSPNSIRVHVVLGDIYVELKDYRKAIEAYEQAIQLGKGYHTTYMVKIYHNLGNLYYNLREYSKAERYYRQVLKMAGPERAGFSRALEDLGQLAFVQGKKQRALKLIKKAARYKQKSKASIFSDYPITLAKLALIYEDLGKKDKAILAWEEVYKLGGQNCRKQAYEHLNKLDE